MEELTYSWELKIMNVRERPHWDTARLNVSTIWIGQVCEWMQNVKPIWKKNWYGSWNMRYWKPIRFGYFYLAQCEITPNKWVNPFLRLGTNTFSMFGFLNFSTAHVCCLQRQSKVWFQPFLRQEKQLPIPRKFRADSPEMIR